MISYMNSIADDMHAKQRGRDAEVAYQLRDSIAPAFGSGLLPQNQRYFGFQQDDQQNEGRIPPTSLGWSALRRGF